MPYQATTFKKFADQSIVLIVFCTSVCSAFLGNIKEAFDKDPELSNLLLDEFFTTAIQRCQVGFFHSVYLESYVNLNE